jgi:YHS domain-containing protein
MIVKYVLILLLIVFVARAFWRVVDGLLAGLSGTGPREPQQGRVQMVRDPVCGTFVLPSQAITLGDGSRRVSFCSTECRDKYRARTA